MINICFMDDGKRIGLTMQGHAGTAPFGEDLVCAAVTMMAYTAAQEAQNLCAAGKLEAMPSITLNSGDAVISMIPRQEHLEEARICMRVIRAGCDVLAANYGKAVRIFNVGNGESR